MESIKVAIVEDDFMVAGINKEVTERVEGFEVTVVAKTGEEALAYIEHNRVDLVILDVYLPDMLGLELLKTIRKKEYPVDFILITAAHDARTVEEATRFGIVDFIIKPFDFGRYAESLVRYRRRRESLRAGLPLDQAGLDQVMEKQPGAQAGTELPKGIARHTLEKIKTVLVAMDGEITAYDTAKSLCLSRITAHRYLEHLAATGLLDKQFRYKKVGRPAVVYILKQ
jgi:CitB family two-component system response regulator MalR